jgi:hypothetical protein
MDCGGVFKDVSEQGTGASDFGDHKPEIFLAEDYAVIFPKKTSLKNVTYYVTLPMGIQVFLA